MPQKKQHFRFRIPWISGARPATESQSRGPKQRSKSAAKSDTNIPIQRPQFRPPGIAPAPPQGTPRAEPQQQSPTSLVIVESPVSTRPSTPTRVNPPPLSPSPSHITVTDSPSHLPSGHSIEVPPKPASSGSDQEKGKMESPFKTITNSPQTSSQPERMSTHPTGSEPLLQKSEPKMKSPLKIIHKELELETQSKPHQSEEKEIKVGKGNDIKHGHGQSIRRSKAEELDTTASSASGVKTKDAFTRAFRGADKKQKEARETVERKMMFATASPSGKDIKVVSSASADPATSNVSSTIPFVDKVATVNPTQPMDENTVSVVTLAGDNRGATMHVASQSTKKEGSIHIHRAYRTNPEEETTDGEETSSSNSMEKDEVGMAYVNSNIQSINNSMMLHGSISERDPGVRVILPQQPPAPIKPQVNVRRADKLSYQPVVRRRCLRALFLEPSDSDPDNPHKPRRHGCKFRCGEITKDKDTEISVTK